MTGEEMTVEAGMTGEMTEDAMEVEGIVVEVVVDAEDGDTAHIARLRLLVRVLLRYGLWTQHCGTLRLPNSTAFRRSRQR